MPIGTRHGPSPWDTRDVADAAEIDVRSASRKVNQFEERLVFVLRACRALDPRARACDLASMVAGVLDTGGKLARADRRRVERRVRKLLQQIDQEPV